MCTVLYSHSHSHSNHDEAWCLSVHGFTKTCQKQIYPCGSMDQFKIISTIRRLQILMDPQGLSWDKSHKPGLRNESVIGNLTTFLFKSYISRTMQIKIFLILFPYSGMIKITGNTLIIGRI